MLSKVRRLSAIALSLKDLLNWVDRYNSAGIDGLPFRNPGGASLRLSPEEKAQSLNWFWMVTTRRCTGSSAGAVLSCGLDRAVGAAVVTPTANAECINLHPGGDQHAVRAWLGGGGNL